MSKAVVQPRMYSSQETLPETQGTLPEELPSLETAILRTLAYADVFRFPLTSAEITRYLIATNASEMEVQAALNRLLRQTSYLETHGSFYMLRGRSEVVTTRQSRRRIAAELWPIALEYGQRIARLPFVRMVAITGALAVENATESDDIDYLIVTAPGRLWLCRALIILVVRFAKRKGHVICPNFLLSERALHLDDQNVFSAHELAQMIPLSGYDVYKQMLAENQWAADYLPNMSKYLRSQASDTRSNLIKRIAEWLLLSPVGAWLERWEMNRKIARFHQQAGENFGREVRLSADRCQGHFHTHGAHTLDAYAARLSDLGQETTHGR